MKIKNNKTNLNFFTKLFELYQENPNQGFILFIAQDTVAMGGDAFSPLDSLYGKKAVLWGKHHITQFEPEAEKLLDEEIYKRFKGLAMKVIWSIVHMNKMSINKS